MIQALFPHFLSFLFWHTVAADDDDDDFDTALDSEHKGREAKRKALSKEMTEDCRVTAEWEDQQEKTLEVENI